MTEPIVVAGSNLLESVGRLKAWLRDYGRNTSGEIFCDDLEAVLSAAACAAREAAQDEPRIVGWGRTSKHVTIQWSAWGERPWTAILTASGKLKTYEEPLSVEEIAAHHAAPASAERKDGLAYDPQRDEWYFAPPRTDDAVAIRLRDCTKRITDPALDMVCDTSLTPGQTLTILCRAKKVIDQQITDLQETVNRQTGKKQ